MSLSSHQTDLKQSLIDSGEPWTPAWEAILHHDEAYLAAYLKLRLVPRSHLSPKIRELILLSVDASCTHLYHPGIRAHTASALHHGATPSEILEVLQLTSVLGVHALNVGVPLLEEVLAEKSQSITRDNLSSHQQALKDSFISQRGYWSTSWDPVLALSPDFFEAYTQFSSVPFREDHRHLDPKVKELVYCAIDCATTHLYAPGLKLHIRNAINYGATKEEVMEVFELAALMGVQTVVAGAEVLREEAKKAGKEFGAK